MEKMLKVLITGVTGYIGSHLAKVLFEAGGTVNMLQQSWNGQPHFIFASTAGAFDAQSPYARSKLAAEDVIKEKSKNYTIFRFFNVAGSDGMHRQVGRASHLIRIAAETAAGKRDYMSIYGEDYDTPDGSCVRDYIHVVDLVSAIRDTIKHGAFNTPYECIGSGKGYSVFNLLHPQYQLKDMCLSAYNIENRKV
ncbi:NAD-dependent epimerase/dehydratase family protein [bacterium]|nr:NAD-dependent epimerase/dehydratase family protein [bacterium]